MRTQQELALYLENSKARAGQFMQWLKFSSLQEANIALKEVQNYYNHLPHMSKVSVTVSEDQQGYQFGLTHQQWQMVVTNQLDNIVSQSANYEKSKREQQLDFVEYYTINRNEPQGSKYSKRINLINSLQGQQMVYFRPEFLPAYQAGHHKDHLKLGYPSKDNSHAHQFDLAPEVQDAQYRDLTKYRLVYGPIPYYFTGFEQKPVLIDTVSACAVNLMGSSPKDEAKFMPQGRLDEQAYNKECLDMAEFIIKTAKDRGAQKLVMPGFGVGAYIRLLNPSDKDKAKEIMNLAFARKAQQYNISIDWVIWKQDRNALLEKQVLDSQTHGNTCMNHVVEDLMEHAKTLSELDAHVVLLNPGSDRTIGGKYYVNNPQTLEEQMAQASDLLFLHSTYNDDMIRRFENDLHESLSQNRTGVQFSSSNNNFRFFIKPNPNEDLNPSFTSTNVLN